MARESRTGLTPLTSLNWKAGLRSSLGREATSCPAPRRDWRSAERKPRCWGTYVRLDDEEEPSAWGIRRLALPFPSLLFPSLPGGNGRKARPQAAKSTYHRARPATQDFHFQLTFPWQSIPWEVGVERCNCAFPERRPLR